MTTMITEIYEALKEAGASEEKAKAAAEAIQGIREEERLRHIEDRLTRIEGEVNLIKWMLGFLLALALANFWLLIRLPVP